MELFIGIAFIAVVAYLIFTPKKSEIVQEVKAEAQKAEEVVAKVEEAVVAEVKAVAKKVAKPKAPAKPKAEATPKAPAKPRAKKPKA